MALKLEKIMFIKVIKEREPSDDFYFTAKKVEDLHPGDKWEEVGVYTLTDRIKIKTEIVTNWRKTNG